ncbi:MAG TPA: DUF308 domain-containing protein [Rhodoglobus sp.]|nr:DUF308 domain-containing protein [Rhodoglobus sp.]
MTSAADLAPLQSLARGIWWWVLLRGILAVVFGVVALLAPSAALVAIALVFGAYALVDGAFAIVHAVQARRSIRRWGWLLAEGVLSVLAGLAALLLPSLAGFFGGLFVLWTIVIWNIATGIAGVRSAAGAPSGRGRTFAIVAAVVSIVFGVILAIAMLLTPGATVLGLIWVVGIYAIVFGVMLVGTAIHVRRLGREVVTAAD